jgi:hypothetical protein
MKKSVTLEQALDVVKHLSPVDKARLIERILPDIERALAALPRGPRTSLWDLCADLGTAPSAEEIDQARRQEWATFPREDS